MLVIRYSSVRLEYQIHPARVEMESLVDRGPVLLPPSAPFVLVSHLITALQASVIPLTSRVCGPSEAAPSPAFAYRIRCGLRLKLEPRKDVQACHTADSPIPCESPPSPA